MTHICVSNLIIQAVSCHLSPSHYPYQCWNIVIWILRNKVQWNVNRNSYIFIKKGIWNCRQRNGSHFLSTLKYNCCNKHWLKSHQSWPLYFIDYQVIHSPWYCHECGLHKRYPANRHHFLLLHMVCFRVNECSLGYLLIYPPQIATVMKPMSFCSMYSPVSHTKSLGESREWNMVFQGYIWYRLKAF